MSSRPPENEAPFSRETQHRVIGVVCALGIAFSLVVPGGFSIAPVTLMLLGVWSLVRARWHRGDTNFAMVTLLICFALYAAGSAALSAAHGDPAGHFEQYLPFLGATLIAVALQTHTLDLNQLIGGFAMAAVLAAIASIVQVVQAEEIHRASLLTTTNTLGVLGVLYAVLCASALGWPPSQSCNRWRRLLVFGALGGLAVSLLSGSKGSWLALLAVGPMAFAQATNRLGSLARIRWAAAVAIYVLLISALPHSPVFSRIQSFSQHGDSFRGLYWTEGLNMVRANPLMGVGRGEVSRQLVEITTREDGSPLPPELTRDLHNEYLDILAARGLPGLLLTLATLGVPLLLLARSARAADNPNRARAVTGMLFIAAFAVCGLTDVQFQINAKRMTYVLGTLLFVHFASGKPSREQ